VSSVAPDSSAVHVRAIEREGVDLVAMGASRRSGDQLSFGAVADVLLKEAPCSLMLIAPRTRGAVKSAPKGPRAGSLPQCRMLPHIR